MPNQYKNKVVYGNTTLIDISDTTAVASDVAAGKYFYLASGQKVEGTSAGGGTIPDGDNLGYGGGSSASSNIVGTGQAGYMII